MNTSQPGAGTAVHERTARGPLIASGFACVALCVGVFALYESSGDLVGPKVLHAAGGVPYDTDGDGLCDRVEISIGSNPDSVDTDGDSYSDAEELARHSSPKLSLSVPREEEMNVGMGVYERNGELHPVCAIYAHDGDVRNKGFSIGILSGDMLMTLPMGMLGRGARVRQGTSQVPGAAVLVFDPSISSTILHVSGSYSIYATLSTDGVKQAADALNLISVSGIICERVVGSSVVGQGVGSLYRPLGGAAIPNDWHEGEICSQLTVTVGVAGAVVTQEVVEAGCLSGWDSYCDGGCAATVGSTIRIVDPSILIGG